MSSRLFFLFILVVIAGCDQKWHGTIIKKRLYQKGFYVHVPSKRATPIASYPKPKPYPVPVASNSASGAPVQTPSAGSAAPQNQVSRPSAGTSNGSQSPVPNPSVGNGGNPANGSATAVQQNPAVQQNDTAKKNLVITDFPKDSAAVVNVPPKDSVLVQIPPPDTNRMAQNNEPKNEMKFPEGTIGLQIHAGMISGPQEYGRNVKASSFAAGFGIRGILKINEKDAMVADFGYRLNQFYIGDKGIRVYPLTQEAHARERISVNDLYLSFSGRIRTNRKKENPKVKWIDAGICGSSSFRTSHVYKDMNEYPALADQAKRTVKYTGLNWLRSFNYGMNFRFGNDFMSVFANWRFSQPVRSNETNRFLTLPALTFGIEFFVMAE